MRLKKLKRQFLRSNEQIYQLRVEIRRSTQHITSHRCRWYALPMSFILSRSLLPTFFIHLLLFPICPNQLYPQLDVVDKLLQAHRYSCLWCIAVMNKLLLYNFITDQPILTITHGNMFDVPVWFNGFVKIGLYK